MIEWGKIRIQELPGGAPSTCRINVRVPAGFPAEGDDSYCLSGLAVSESGEIRYEVEWGLPVRLSLPLPNSITIEGPTERKRPACT